MISFFFKNSDIDKHSILHEFITNHEKIDEIFHLIMSVR